MPCVPVGDPVLVHSPGHSAPHAQAPRLRHGSPALRTLAPSPVRSGAGPESNDGLPPTWGEPHPWTQPRRGLPRAAGQSLAPGPGAPVPRHPSSPAPLLLGLPGTPAPQNPCSPGSRPPDPCPPAQGPAVRRGSLPGCCLWGLLDIGQADRVRTAYLPTAERPRGGGPQVRVQKDSASSAGQGDRPSRLLRTVPRPLPHASWPGAWAEARSPGSWSHRVEASWPAAMDLPVDSAVLTGFAPRPGPPHGRVAPMSWKPRPPTTQPRRPRTLAPRKIAVLGSGGPLSQPSSTSPCASGQRAPPALGCSPVPSPSLGETPGPPAEVVVNRPTPGPWTGGRTDQDRP